MAVRVVVTEILQNLLKRALLGSGLAFFLDPWDVGFFRATASVEGVPPFRVVVFFRRSECTTFLNGSCHGWKEWFSLSAGCALVFFPSH